MAAAAATAFEVSEETLKQRSGEFSLDTITRLELPACGLNDEAVSKIAELCPNLTELDAADNCIRTAEGLAGLRQLTRLTLTGNQLTDLVFASKLTALEQLFVQGNQIVTAADVEHVGELPALTTLYLQNIDETEQNPICQHIAYRPAVTMRVPALRNLDGQRVAMDTDPVRSGPTPTPELPQATIPDSEPWVQPEYWKPTGSGIAAEKESAAFGASMKDCRKLEASADAIIDRYAGFANIKGKLT